MACFQAFPHFQIRPRYSTKSRPEKMLLGTDLVWIPEIQRSIMQFGERYLQRMFSPQELSDCHGLHQKDYASLAARVAAKEATMKILGLTKESVVPWNSIEVIRRQNGSPVLRLHRQALAFARAARIDECVLSLSHEQDYAIATVIGTSR